MIGRHVIYALLLAAMLNASQVGFGEVFIGADEAYKLLGKEHVVFVNADSDDVYKLGHIDGARPLHAATTRLRSITGELPCEPLRLCIDDAQNVFRRLGIEPEDLVIVYDGYLGINAIGNYRFFKRYGHDRVKVLEGGRDAIASIDPKQFRYMDLRSKYNQERGSYRGAKRALDGLMNGSAWEQKSKMDIYAEGRNTKQKERADAKSKLKEKSDKAALTEKLDRQKKLVGKMGKEMDNFEQTMAVHRGRLPSFPPSEYVIEPSKVNIDGLSTTEEMVAVSEEIMRSAEKGLACDKLILDVRGMIGYIGERKQDLVARGGHIPGAKIFEFRQILDYENKRPFIDEEAMKKVFSRLGITKDKTIYVYSHDGTAREHYVAQALEALCYPRVKVYTGGWLTWGNALSLPIRR